MINFDPIQANLYLGSAPSTQDDIASLKALKVTAVVCMQSDEDLVNRNIDWQELSAWYTESDIAHQRFAMQDFNEAELAEKIEPAVAALDEFINAGHSVYVHCNSGIYRAPTTVLGYLCSVKEMSMADALRELRIARPVVAPSKSAVELLLKKS